MAEQSQPSGQDVILSAQDLMAGSGIVHEVHVPPEILQPLSSTDAGAAPGKVRLRPLSVAALSMISRAARDDAGLIPLLMIKESVVEPALTLDQIRQMHVGMAHFLVSRINTLSGLEADGEMVSGAVQTPITQAHILLAKHFGWTPQQVGQLTPAQVAVYLAGIDHLSAAAGER